MKQRLPRAALQLAGFFHGQAAFTGPKTVQVDLTDACNQTCLVCWLHAPALRGRNKARLERLASLPWETYLSLLDELRDLGTEEIYFAGGGEPMVYPRIWEALEAALTRGFTASLHTNFSLVDSDGVRRLIDLGVHHLTVSLWAGTTETYAATHPGTDPGVFQAVCERLNELNERKVDRPTTKLYHVLNHKNAADVQPMLDLAQNCGCDAVELATADVIPGATDPEALTPDQAREVLDVVRPWLDRSPWRTPRLLGGASLVARLEAIASHQLSDSELVHQIPCFAGWTYARVLADGQVIPCLKAHRLPSGNLHENTFSEIWNGSRQRTFRQAARSVRKEGSLFSEIGNSPGTDCGCELGCDNLEENKNTAARLSSLTSVERSLIRVAGRVPALLGSADEPPRLLPGNGR